MAQESLEVEHQTMTDLPREKYHYTILVHKGLNNCHQLSAKSAQEEVLGSQSQEVEHQDLANPTVDFIQAPDQNKQGLTTGQVPPLDLGVNSQALLHLLPTCLSTSGTLLLGYM